MSYICKIRSAAFLLSVSLLAAGAFATDLNGDLIQTSGDPSVAAGVFYGYQTPSKGPGDEAFEKAKALAEREGVPLVVVWSNEECIHCDHFITELNGKPNEVKAWLKENRAVFTYFKDRWEYPYPYTGSVCHEVAEFLYESCKCKDPWPLFGFYYKAPGMADGIYWGNSAVGERDKTFSELKTWYAQWVKDNHIGGDGNGRFAAVSGTEGDRYEIDGGTTNLYVRLTRDEGRSRVDWVNDLVADWPEGTGERTTVQVAWKAGESARTVSVPLKRAGTGFPVGANITLTLVDCKSGSSVGTVSAACVTPETSASNPLWIGEPFGFGEWTMDLDAAKAKVAAADGAAYTVISLQGSKWCPDCANVDRNFLDLTNEVGQNRFCLWAKTKNVALVTIDIPNFNGPKATNYASPSLLDRTAFETTLARATEYPQSGADAALLNKMKRSGLGYLSRKMVDEATAATYFRRNHDLASKNTDAGGFHRPEDGNANRTGVPIFVLLRKDGTVAARLTQMASVSPMAADRANFENYLKRFEEMMSIADGAHADAAEIENNHPHGTALSVASAGGEVRGEICNADFQDVFRLDGAGERTYQWVEVSGEGSAEVEVSFQTTNAAGKAETVAQTTGALSGVISLTHRFPKKGDYFVQVKGADIASSEFAVDSAKADNFQAYRLVTKSVLEPVEKASEARASSGSTTVQMHVLSNVEYRVTGIVGGVSGKFEKEHDDFYRAKVDDVVELTTQTPGGVVAFQIWRPGEVEFRDPKGVRVIEYAGTGIVAVVRSEGSSGSNVVKVVCDEKPIDNRFAWTDTTLVWADGESGEKSVRFPIRPNGTYDNPDVSFKVRLVAGEPCPAAVSSATNVVTVYDTNLPCLEKTAYDLRAILNFETELALKAYNVSNASTVAVTTKKGSGEVPAGLGFEYDAESGSFLLQGVPTAPGDYEFVVTVGEKRNGKATSGFETTVRIMVSDPSEINPKLAEKRINTTMPIYCEIGDGTNVIEGSLRFAITSTGKISAKYTGTEGASLSFAGNWLTIDADGTVSNRLEAASDPDALLTMTMDREGFVNLILDLPNRYSHFKGDGESIRLVAESEWPDTAADFTPWKGTYNVTFPYLGGTPTNVPTGTGYFALRMESSLAAKSGLVIVAGVLPDGTPVSGSCQLLRDRMFEGVRPEGVAYLPIFRRTGNSCFSAATEIGRDGAKLWNSDEPGDERLLREIVYSIKGTAAMSLYRDSAWEYLTLHDVCGSYYVPGVSPEYLQSTFDYGASLFANFGIGCASASSTLGRIEIPETRIQLTIGENGIDFSEPVKGMGFTFDSRTGIFCGAAKLTYTYGNENDQTTKTVVGHYRGVLLPGWIDCNCGRTVPVRPFGSGTFCFKDIVDKKIVMRSFPVDIDK